MTKELFLVQPSYEHFIQLVKLHFDLSQSTSYHQSQQLEWSQVKDLFEQKLLRAYQQYQHQESNEQNTNRSQQPVQTALANSRPSSRLSTKSQSHSRSSTPSKNESIDKRPVDKFLNASPNRSKPVTLQNDRYLLDVEEKNDIDDLMGNDQDDDDDDDNFDEEDDEDQEESSEYNPRSFKSYRSREVPGWDINYTMDTSKDPNHPHRQPNNVHQKTNSHQDKHTEEEYRFSLRQRHEEILKIGECKTKCNEYMIEMDNDDVFLPDDNDPLFVWQAYEKQLKEKRDDWKGRKIADSLCRDGVLSVETFLQVVKPGSITGENLHKTVEKLGIDRALSNSIYKFQKQLDNDHPNDPKVKQSLCKFATAIFVNHFQNLAKGFNSSEKQTNKSNNTKTKTDTNTSDLKVNKKKIVERATEKIKFVYDFTGLKDKIFFSP